jgi:hypothetical protein
LAAHAIIQGGVVAVVTGLPVLGLAEAVLHWLIDFGKCEGWFGFNADQTLHVACKALWVAVWVVTN